MSLSWLIQLFSDARLQQLDLTRLTRPNSEGFEVEVLTLPNLLLGRIVFADVSVSLMSPEISRVTKFHQGLMDASPVEGDVCVFFDLVWAFADFTRVCEP